tara:strand:+ start:589 stop:846 length:258 start_codon:yes stop_codon:yes gene_type:complete
MEKVKGTTNMWRYREGFIQDNGDGWWIGLNKYEKTIARRSTMKDVKSSLDKIFDGKADDNLTGQPVTHLSNMLDAHIFGPNRFKR